MNRRLEREADRFAAAFLMPIALLTRELTTICESVNTDAAKMLLAVAAGEEQAHRTFSGHILPKIARRFVVSKSAALWRFADLQIPTGEQAVPAEVINQMLGPKSRSARQNS